MARLISILGLLIFFSSSEGATLVRGPYLQSASSTGVVVRWRTDVPTGSRVRYGPEGANLLFSAGTTSPLTEHQVPIGGLIPHTQYFYSIGDDSSTLAAGSDYFFVTSPTNEHATRIWVIGDSGTANSSARAVRDAFLNFAGSRSPDVWLMLGDNAYYNATDEEYQAAMFDMYPMLLRNTPVWSTFGNHEGFSANSLTQTGPYFDIFTFPTNAQAGGVPSGTEGYFSFDYGDIHFVCLESTMASRATNGPMLNWLRSDLASASPRWLIAYFHHSPYSKSHHDSDLEPDLAEIRRTILPILEAGGVDLVLTGHSHVYERSFFLNGHYDFSSSLDPSMIMNSGNGREDGDGAYVKATFAKAPNEGTVYAVVGSSGQTSGGSLDHPVMVTSQIRLGSMTVDIEANRLDGRFLDRDGLITDYFTILKGVQPPERPSAPGNLTATASSITSIQLTWTDNSGEEQRYILQRSTDGSNFVEIARFPSGTTSFVDMNLYASTRYYYRVRAGNQGGDSTNSNVGSIITPALANALMGPSSAVRPYVLPAIPPVTTRSIYTSVKTPPDARDNVGGKRLVGAPTGLGFMDNGNGTMTLVASHWLDATEGIVRRHGSAGSFISKLIVRGNDLSVQSVSDLMTNVYLWASGFNQFFPGTNVTFIRLSLGDLPRDRAFYNSSTLLGTQQRIFLAGEETETNGRLFAHFVSGSFAGSSVELPHLGKMSFRQAVACQERQNRTVLALLDRSGRVYFYAGTKSSSAAVTGAVNHATAAGLTGGSLFGLAISNAPAELNYIESKGERVPFRLVNMGNVQNITSSNLQGLANANGTTLFAFPGGGSWDPNESDAFYFSTSGGIQGTNTLPGRVWKLKFADIAQPELGGTVQMLLDGKEGVFRPGSVTIDESSSMLIAETPGDDARLARLFTYDLTNTKGFTNQLRVLGIFDPTRFSTNGLTQAEQVMGMVDLAPMLGPDQYMFAAWAPYDIADAELVEGGQLIFMHNLGVPFRIVDARLSNRIFSLSWASTPYATYNVQYKTSITQAGWTDLTNVFATAFTASAQSATASNHRYFRVRRIR